ncbi:4-hydroxy-tetrahydrodipicolinate reductase [Rubrivirga sp. SAORIC476]|uniref:4-hydroxy-tetrahydrodipicolinate reductase n=1 Tax=Rubrivirga sp. SAORIC476 TaxID=1961794 RepID=UPI000BA98B6A|nr:4-hydroxy-tetrahydrodipicolinate reductase [Rubrivirga sp. SAORIC476]PAP79140.1 4-hydroxy-tetrahydrodipicolinate reductase [Rubrivirga sp. SAORIC476]
MQFALVGTGRMGQAVDAVAAERGHAIVARFDAEAPLLDARDASALNGAEAVIDFSIPEVALDQIHRYAFWGVDAVVGTTGWTDHLDQVVEWVAEGQNGLLWAPNFSLGLALVSRALAGLLPLLDRLDEYDAAVHEVHHTGKLDSPSGTALRLAEELLAGLGRKTHIEAETQHGAIDPAALHVTSQRLGRVLGEHTVALDSEVDQIQIVHTAKSRRAFALGAVRAAEWVAGRQGVFTLEDMLQGEGTEG